MDKSYYQKYFELERKHWWFKARNSIINEHIKFLLHNKESKNLKILNVGAGTGYTSEMLMKYGEVTSIEYDKECCEMVKNKTTINIEYGDINNLEFDENSFDLVTAFDVIEHVKNDQNAVNELIRVTKTKGLIFTTVPAYNFLWSSHDIVNHHFRRYTSKTFLKLWENNSTKKIYSSYINFYLFPIIATLRIFSKILNKKNISDFDTYKISVFDNILFKIFYNEKIFIKKRIPLPFGLTFLSSFRKCENEK